MSVRTPTLKIRLLGRIFRPSVLWEDDVDSFETVREQIERRLREGASREDILRQLQKTKGVKIVSETESPLTWTEVHVGNRVLMHPKL